MDEKPVEQLDKDTLKQLARIEARLDLIEGSARGLLVMMLVAMLIGIALMLLLNIFLIDATAYFTYDLGGILAAVFGGGGVMIAALAYARKAAPPPTVERGEKVPQGPPSIEE